MPIQNYRLKICDKVQLKTEGPQILGGTVRNLLAWANVPGNFYTPRVVEAFDPSDRRVQNEIRAVRTE